MWVCERERERETRGAVPDLAKDGVCRHVSRRVLGTGEAELDPLANGLRRPLGHTHTHPLLVLRHLTPQHRTYRGRGRRGSVRRSRE